MKKKLDNKQMENVTGGVDINFKPKVSLASVNPETVEIAQDEAIKKIDKNKCLQESD